MQMFFKYPLNYTAAEEAVESNANALLLSNNNFNSGVSYSSAGTSSVVFTTGPVNSVASTMTDLFIISDGITQIAGAGAAVKKTRGNNDREPTSVEVFYHRTGLKDYSLITIGSVSNTITLTFTHTASGVVYEVYLLQRLGTWDKIEDIRYEPTEKRNEFVREGFYGKLSKQRVSSIRNKRAVSVVARGNRVQMEALDGYAEQTQLTYAANLKLEPTLIFPALMEITGPRQHVARWQSDVFRMPYRVREI